MTPQLLPIELSVIREALEAAQNGLAWYRDRSPEAVDGSDDEADDLIARALSSLDQVVKGAPTGLLARAEELHEKAFMPWNQAEKLALSEVGVDDGQIDELIGNSSPTSLTTLLDPEEVREFVRSVLVYAQAAQTAPDHLPDARKMIALLSHGGPREQPSHQVFGIIDPDYATAFTKTRIAAWQHGYAITLHGSFTRDLDLVAVPWTDRACDVETLVAAIEYRTCLKRQGPCTDKPHGRKAVSLLFPAFEDPRWIDLSIMPRRLAQEVATA